MERVMLKSKIHRATVTEANLDYIGSLTIDRDLMDHADLLAGELVHLVDVNNGSRLQTYVIEGPRKSGVIGVNGAAARLVQTGDIVIILAYANVRDEDARSISPRVVFVNEKNQAVEVGAALDA